MSHLTNTAALLERVRAWRDARAKLDAERAEILVAGRELIGERATKRLLDETAADTDGSARL